MLSLCYGFLISRLILVLPGHDSFASLFCQHVFILNKLLFYIQLCAKTTLVTVQPLNPNMTSEYTHNHR